MSLFSRRRENTMMIEKQTAKTILFYVLTCAVFFAFILIACFAGVSGAHAKTNTKYGSIVIDADSGAVLSERYADKTLHPASLTKAMTLMMLFDAIDQGKVGLRDRIVISRHAASMVPSKLDLPVGSSIKVKDAIYALVTKSANDVAAAIGEHLAGTESNFAKKMTSKAREIGMKKTTFKNASGLHDKRQVTTPRDMALMARHMIFNYPRHYKYFSTQYFTYLGKTYRNHNRLMETYSGMDGLKTGYINASGFNLVASAVRGEHRLIGVVFGGRSSRTRNSHMENLLDSGFEKVGSLKVMAYNNVPLPSKKPSILRAIASLNNLSPSNGDGQKSNWASLNTSLQNGMFGQIIGEGDSDPAASKRIETGLIAIAAHNGDHQPSPYMKSLKLNAANHPQKLATINDKWSIQIGAFASRAQTDRAIADAVKTLPAGLNNANSIIVPMKKNNNWLFRGRLNGYTEAQAKSACTYLKDCIAIEPRRYQ